MGYKEVIDILPRNQEDELMKILNEFSLLIDDAINFGTNIIKWDTDKKRDGDENMPPLLFLRNILELGDAISILIKNSSIDTCKPLLRSLLENMFGLEYLLETDSTSRALSYIVWHTHKNLKLYKKLNSADQSGKQFRKELDKDRLIKGTNHFFDNPELITAEKIAEDLLKLPKYLAIETEYHKTCSTKTNPKWYSLFGGPNNIEQLAKHLNHHASYEVLYREYSGNVHATNIFQKKLISNSDGTVAIVQIRYPADAQSVALNTLNIIILSYLTYYKSRVPERNQDFQNWYLVFREYFNKLSEVNFINIID